MGIGRAGIGDDKETSLTNFILLFPEDKYGFFGTKHIPGKGAVASDTVETGYLWAGRF